MVVAKRSAGCLPASAVTSRARRSSMRRERALAPTKSVLQTGVEVLSLPHFLEEGEPHVAILDGDVARPKKRTGSAGAMRGPQAGR